MPSKKILVVFIIFFGIVISVWFIAKKQQTLKQLAPSKIANVTAESPIQIKDADYDWKKIITNIDSKELKVEKILNGEDEFDENNLTDQMSRDLFSKLMFASKQGEVDSNIAKGIAESTLSSSQYTKISGVTYLSSNLKIVQNNDLETIRKYYESMNKSMGARLLKNVETPISIVDKAMLSQNPAELLKLNPYIEVTKGMIKDLLAMEVPQEVAHLHLNMLNSYSKLQTSLEGIKIMFDDPVNAVLVIPLYAESIESFNSSIITLNNYFQSKLKL